MHTAYPPVKGEPSLHQIPPHTKHLCLAIDFIRANTHCTLLHISLYKRGLSKRHVHYAPLRVECLPQHFTYTYTHRFDSKVWKIFRTFFNVFGLVVSSTTMVCLTPLYVDVSNSLPPFRHKLSHSNLRYARSTRCNGATRTFAIYIYIYTTRRWYIVHQADSFCPGHKLRIIRQFINRDGSTYRQIYMYVCCTA